MGGGAGRLTGNRPPADGRDLGPGFTPETELEAAGASDRVLLEGLAWGKPRKGHPEGSVGRHVADLLDTIDDWNESGQRRSTLRFIALVHDALKYRVSDWLPKAGENHHAMRARRFAERYTDDERLLAAIELHDRPYAIWRRSRGRSERRNPDRSGEHERGRSDRRGAKERRAVDELVKRLPDPSLFMRFVELDGSTEGKDPEPVGSFKEELASRGLRPGARR